MSIEPHELFDDFEPEVLEAMKFVGCQACHEQGDNCLCNSFKGDQSGECENCGALYGQHLLDFARQTDRWICPSSTKTLLAE